MKKLSKIAFATLAGLAMIVSATSCVQIHAADEPMGDLKDQYVRGSMNNWANDNIEDGALTKNEDGTYSFIFKATAETEEFGVADKDWISKYSDGTVEAGKGYAKIGVGSGLGNATITGLKKGSVYTMTILAGPTAIDVKVELGGKLNISYDSLPFYLDGYFLKGGFLANEWNDDAANLVKGAELDVENMKVTYKVKFTATKDDEYFAISSKDNRYIAELVVGEDFKKLEFTTDGMKSCKSSGIKKDGVYVLEIYTTSDKDVYAKLVKMDPVQITVKIQDLPAKVTEDLYLAGDYNNWKAPGTDPATKFTDGTMSFELYVLSGEEKEFQVKISASSWKPPIIGGPDGSNAKIKVSSVKKNVTVKVTGEMDGKPGEYKATWTVD